MPTTKVTKEMCAIDTERFNIATLVPYAVQAINLIMTERAEHYAHHFQNDNDGNLPDWDLLEPRWPLQWAGIATELPDFLRSIYPEIYGENGPVEIGMVGDYALLENDEEGGGANATVRSSATGLYRLARRYGVTHVFDGQGFTFFEGNESEHWYQMMVLRDLQYRLTQGMEYPAMKFLHRFRKGVEQRMIFGDSDLCPSWGDC